MPRYDTKCQFWTIQKVIFLELLQIVYEKTPRKILNQLGCVWVKFPKKKLFISDNKLY